MLKINSIRTGAAAEITRRLQLERLKSTFLISLIKVDYGKTLTWSAGSVDSELVAYQIIRDINANIAGDGVFIEVRR